MAYQKPSHYENQSPPVTNLILTTATASHAQVQTLVNQLWVDTTGHPISNSYFMTAKNDGSGNILVAGSTYHQGQSANVLITKYTSGGTKLWQFEFNTASNYADIVTDLYVKGNSYYVTGTAWDSANFRSRVFICRGNATTGDTVWSRTYLGAYGGYSAGASILPDNGGNIYIAGSEQQSATNFSMLVMKYDSTGTQLWTSAYDSAGYYDAGIALLLNTTKNSVVVTGFSGSGFANWDFVTAPFNQTTGAWSSGATGRSSNGNGAFSQPVGIGKDYSDNTYIAGTSAINATNTDIKIIKYDTLFNEVWVRRWGKSDSLKDEATAFAQDINANLLVTGFTTSNGGGRSALLLKYNTVGNLVWSRTLNAADPTRNCIAKDVTTDTSLNIYITGSVSNGSDNDIFTASYDKDGGLKWYKTYSTEEGINNEGYDILADNDQNIYVSGMSMHPYNPNFITINYKLLDLVNEVNIDTILGKYINGQVLVRFNPSLVDTMFVNNKDIVFASLSDILPDSIIDVMNAIDTITDFNRVTVCKIFDYLSTSDSLSIRRNGDTISMPKFWSNFILVLPQIYVNRTPEVVTNIKKNTISNFQNRAKLCWRVNFFYS